MNPTDLERLLQRLDDGVATPEERQQVEAFLDEVEREGLVGDTLRAEAGVIDIADAVLAAVAPLERRAPVSDAVRAHAGTVDVVDEVALFTTDEWLSAMLDHELDPRLHRMAAHHLAAPGAGARMTAMAEVGHSLREAVAAEGGEIDLWDGVAHALGMEHPEEVPGWDGALVAEAVRSEAGSVDVADEVVRRVKRSALAAAPFVAPVAANTPSRRWMGGLALAAAAVLAVFVGRGLIPATPDMVAWDVQFASAEEIAITDLTYDANTEVFVFQGSGENAPLIIWVEDSEEVRL